MIESPWQEDIRRCREGQHLWILFEDGKIYCYNCGIRFKK